MNEPGQIDLHQNYGLQAPALMTFYNYHQYIAWPPVALIVCPVIHPASALHNQATTPANSSGVPTLCCKGVLAQILSIIPGIFFSVSRNNSLSTAPGVTQLTVVPSSPSSCARWRVIASRPALLAA